jgi:hypothetical protein
VRTSARDDTWIDTLVQFHAAEDRLWGGSAPRDDAPGWFGDVSRLILVGAGPPEPDERADEAVVVAEIHRWTRHSGGRVVRRVELQEYPVTASDASVVTGCPTSTMTGRAPSASLAAGVVAPAPPRPLRRAWLRTVQLGRRPPVHDTKVAGLEAVVDACALERFALLGISGGGAGVGGLRRPTPRAGEQARAVRRVRPGSHGAGAHGRGEARSRPDG